jgi:abortive infection bacteriophage resistance protein
VNKKPFSKPALDYERQLQQLVDRGMAVGNKEFALHVLKHVNYYRLGAYWLPFETNHSTHKFKPDTCFENVYALYCFDKQLRLLVMEAIEHIKVSVRATWAYEMAHRYGTHSHLDPTHAACTIQWDENLLTLKKQVKQSSASELFVKHFSGTYIETMPPVWAVSELMSFGLLSKWFNNIRCDKARRSIAKVYQVDERILAPWLQHLVHVRNTCAHHSRLWNRVHVVNLPLIKNKKSALFNEFNTKQKCTYNSLVICLYLMDVIVPNHDWRSRLKALLLGHPQHLKAMGFPVDWESRSLWN